jgi:hypothetical protein
MIVIEMSNVCRIYSRPGKEKNGHDEAFFAITQSSIQKKIFLSFSSDCQRQRLFHVLPMISHGSFYLCEFARNNIVFMFKCMKPVT